MRKEPSHIFQLLLLVSDKLGNFKTLKTVLIWRTLQTKHKSYIFDGIPQEFDAGLYHSWALDEQTFPGELEVTARAEDNVIMAFSHREYDLTGFQFHPESIMTKFGKQMLQNWLKR